MSYSERVDTDGGLLPRIVLSSINMRLKAALLVEWEGQVFLHEHPEHSSFYNAKLLFLFLFSS